MHLTYAGIMHIFGSSARVVLENERVHCLPHRDAYPKIASIKQTVSRVRDLDRSDGSSARVRVLTSRSNGFGSWGSVGLRQDVIDASWTAPSDGSLIGLMRAKRGPTDGYRRSHLRVSTSG